MCLCVCVCGGGGGGGGGPGIQAMIIICFFCTLTMDDIIVKNAKVRFVFVANRWFMRSRSHIIHTHIHTNGYN